MPTCRIIILFEFLNFGADYNLYPFLFWTHKRFFTFVELPFAVVDISVHLKLIIGTYFNNNNYTFNYSALSWINIATLKVSLLLLLMSFSNLQKTKSDRSAKRKSIAYQWTFSKHYQTCSSIDKSPLNTYQYKN